MNLQEYVRNVKDVGWQNCAFIGENPRSKVFIYGGSRQSRHMGRIGTKYGQAEYTLKGMQGPTLQIKLNKRRRAAVADRLRVHK